MDSSQRPQFGNRFLIDKNEIFNHNAWDNVEWDEEQENEAQKKVKENSEVTFSSREIEEMTKEACGNWNKFYSIHQNRFFKDRHWLFTEFNELKCRTKQEKIEDDKKCDLDALSSTIKSLRKDEIFPGEKSSFRILEVGCGVGNTVFPILQQNIDPHLYVYCCDFSETAISIIRESENYDSERCHAFVCDISEDVWRTPFPEESLDTIVCIFVLSALEPERIRKAVRTLASYLKPGGVLLFRDYGRFDMAQLRFKKGAAIGDNFYRRGDGTFCYFFTQDEVKEIMAEAGLEEMQNLVDRRLQVNRGKQLTMYRVWIQGKYKKNID